MNQDELVRAKMEEMFFARPWRGIVSQEEALAFSLHYRGSLNAQEREAYDEQIMSGRHPSNAQELIEIMREAGVFKAELEVAIAKAS